MALYRNVHLCAYEGHCSKYYHVHRASGVLHRYYYHHKVPFELMGNEPKNSGGRNAENIRREFWNVCEHR